MGECRGDTGAQGARGEACEPSAHPDWGCKGPQGDTGPSAIRYAASINANGTVQHSYSAGAAPTIQHPGAGAYDFTFSTDVRLVSASATVRSQDPPVRISANDGGSLGGSLVNVEIATESGVSFNTPFYIEVIAIPS